MNSSTNKEVKTSLAKSQTAGKKSSTRNNQSPRRPAGNRSTNRPQTQTTDKTPEIAPGVIRVIPLGGVEQIGKNMTAIEYGDTIIVVDIGLEFPDEETPGVDYIIPDATYVEKRKHKVKGVLITHAHLDHIGGIPYTIGKIGNPTIYTSLLTAVMIKKRQEEFPHLPALDIKVVDQKDTLKLGSLEVSFFGATHTIPDTLGINIKTPYGHIIVTGDIKIENKDGQPEPFEVETYEALGRQNNLLLVADSTNAEKEGFSFPEKEVQRNLKKIIADIPGRIIVSTFASLFERIIFVIAAAEELGKKVVVEGRSMKTNVEIAKELGILKIKKETIIGAEYMDDYPDNKLVILATGAQGDAFAALMRISNREHRFVKIRKGDTVLLSSSIVPGNERNVQKLKDNLARQGANILHYGIADVHSSGHSYRSEIEWVHKMLKPRFLIPVHGHHHMLRVHAGIAMGLGLPEKNIIIPDNGQVIEITDQGQKITAQKKTGTSRVVMVDGLGMHGVQDVVIRDRQMLSQDGMFVIIAIIDLNTGKVRKSPDIISRGFVYLKESQDLLREVRQHAKRTIEDSTSKMHPINFDYVKNTIRDEIGKYLYQKTHKRPIILPVLIEV
ncbi:MAG: ribonuclease J [Candidatus Paceibacterota bacterium]